MLDIPTINLNKTYFSIRTNTVFKAHLILIEIGCILASDRQKNGNIVYLNILTWGLPPKRLSNNYNCMMYTKVCIILGVMLCLADLN